jgi:hypothetical protein
MTSGDLVTGQIDEALDFDGSDDNLTTVSDVADPDTNANFTASAWINPPSLGGLRTIFSKRDSGGSRLAVFVAANGNLSIQGTFGGNTEFTNLTVSTNTFSHVVVTRNGDSYTIYLDTVSQTLTANNTTTQFDTPFLIGANGTFDRFLGVIDEFQFHSEIKTSAWVNEEYDQTNDNATFWGTWTNVSAGTTYNVSVSESLTLSESQSITIEIPVSISESLSLDDTQAASYDLAVAVLEQITLNDTVSEEAGGTVYNVSVTESMTFSDTQSASLTIPITINETFNLNDVIDTTANYIVSVVENMTLSDIISSGEAAKGRMCITITATKSEITITAVKPDIDIEAEECT